MKVPSVENDQPTNERKPTRLPVTIRNPLGLHMRPAAAIAKAAGKYQSAIMIYKGTRAANAKSFTNLLMLAAGCGTELIVEADGVDACEAAQTIAEMLGSTAPDGAEPRAT